MQDIHVGRYSAEGVTVAREYTSGAGETWGGWIEPDDKSWIIFLDPEGAPVAYWPKRTETGAVVGDGIVLAA